VIVLVEDPVVRQHLVAALRAHAQRCRRDAVPFPPALVALLAGLLAGDGQTRPALDVIDDDGHADGMAPLTVSYRAAADALSVSERSVRRLVASRKLPAVDVGGNRRIRTRDLVEYVDRLGANDRRASA
jgi:excisionase family DNA binding protein